MRRVRALWRGYRSIMQLRLLRAGHALGLLPPTRRTERLDLLFGIAAIARFMGLSKGQARGLVARRAIPCFELDGVACARRSSIVRHLQALEARAGGDRP